MRPTSPPEPKHVHQHNMADEPYATWFEDGAFIEQYQCHYTEGRTYTDYARDETYHATEYACEETESARFDLKRVEKRPLRSEEWEVVAEGDDAFEIHEELGDQLERLEVAIEDELTADGHDPTVTSDPFQHQGDTVELDRRLTQPESIVVTVETGAMGSISYRLTYERGSNE